MLLLLLLAATPYQTCESDAECTAPEECVAELETGNTVCRAPCVNDGDCDDAGGTAICGSDDHCVLFCDDRTGIACPAGFACIAAASVCGFIDIDPDVPVPCTCDDDCPVGAACVDFAGNKSCVATCAANNSTCLAEGAACTLGPDVGLCLPGQPPDLDGGAVCTNGGECRTNVCELNIGFGRNVCVEACDADDDCADGTACVDGVCEARSIVCEADAPPVDDPPDDVAEPASCSSRAAPGLLFALLAMLRRRPR